MPFHVWCTTSNLLLSMVVFCLNPHTSVNLYSRCLLLFNELNIIYYHKHNSFICCFIAKNPDWQQYDSKIYRQNWSVVRNAHISFQPALIIDFSSKDSILMVSSVLNYTSRVRLQNMKMMHGFINSIANKVYQQANVSFVIQP